MSYTTAEGRRDILDALGEATDAIGAGLASVGTAYEQLDETTADRLETEIFRPAQAAYGRARRTHAEFSGRAGVPPRTFRPAAGTAAARGVRTLIDDAVEAFVRADEELSELQDSMLPVEVGDPELRAGLEDVRTRLSALPARADALLRLLGR